MTVISAVPAVFARGYYETHRDSCPDGFLKGRSMDEIFTVSFDRIPYGLFQYVCEGKKAEFGIWFETGCPEYKKERILAFVCEFMIRKHHPEKLHASFCAEKQVFSACGFYPKGKGMLKIVEPWRLKLDDRVFDDEGYIINQGMMKDIPYGWFDTAAKGCGWIAAYNLLKMNGMETAMQECAECLEKRTVLGGVMGSEIMMVMLWLKKKGLKVRMTLPSDLLCVRAVKTSSSGILLYTHARGAHYTAYRRNPDGTLQFYNAVYGRRNHNVRFEEFLKQHALFPVSSVIYVEGPNDQ